MAAKDAISPKTLNGKLFVGELTLDGGVRAPRGWFAYAESCLSVYPDMPKVLISGCPTEPYHGGLDEAIFYQIDTLRDLSEVRLQTVKETETRNNLAKISLALDRACAVLADLQNCPRSPGYDWEPEGGCSEICWSGAPQRCWREFLVESRKA